MTLCFTTLICIVYRWSFDCSLFGGNSNTSFSSISGKNVGGEPERRPNYFIISSPKHSPLYCTYSAPMAYLSICPPIHSSSSTLTLSVSILLLFVTGDDLQFLNSTQMAVDTWSFVETWDVCRSDICLHIWMSVVIADQWAGFPLMGRLRYQSQHISWDRKTLPSDTSQIGLLP